MARIAFYAPLKPPDHPVASGDRAMARNLIAALRLAGHVVEIASRFRSFDAGDPARQKRLRNVGQRLAERLIRRYERAPSPPTSALPEFGMNGAKSGKTDFAWGGDRGGAAPVPPEKALHKPRPDLWLTYHLYHKAPDWLGPEIAARLEIPYLLAEASYAPKQAGGRWDRGHRAVADAIRQADRVFHLNATDAECVAPLLHSPERLAPLPPFLDAVPFRAPNRDASRGAVAAAYGLDPAEPWLLTVAMMREDQKLLSYRCLAEALSRLTDLQWRIVIAGAGPAEAAVRQAFAPMSERVAWIGMLDRDALVRAYRAADLYVWPAIKEAWGMGFLEAQAAGLPVVAGRGGGVPGVVADGETGLLTPEGDADAFAAAVRVMLGNPARRISMGEAATRRIAERHDLPVAAAVLDGHIRAVLGR
jgi:glycosyltransferase involved in cell wall biosynthesis